MDERPQRKKPVVVVEYDPEWPRAFERLRARIAPALGEVAVAIEHVGSTAVPGLAAKPIIDLDVVVPSAADVPAAIARLAALGYRHQGDLGIPGREAFGYPPGDAPGEAGDPGWPAHHLYVCPADGAELRRHLALRDYLRTHPEARDAYAAAKREGARRFAGDRDAYQEHKSATVRETLQRAMAEPPHASAASADASGASREAVTVWGEAATGLLDQRADRWSRTGEA